MKNIKKRLPYIPAINGKVLRQKMIKIQKIYEEIMEKYSEVFEKLAQN